MTYKDDQGGVAREAHDLVHGDRGADYGHPLEDFQRTAKLWSVILGCDVTPDQVALCMIQVKVSREINSPKRDNLVDICGYAETAQMVKDERNDRDYAATTFGPLTGLRFEDLEPSVIYGSAGEEKVNDDLELAPGTITEVGPVKFRKRFGVVTAGPAR